ncbi:MAG: ABC transporter ATP-binding protein [Verrucomicrobia bacterium]|nr:ABC transporter ATP-binding protein [Verrucomicrobiota bacterium]MDA1340474.1 ABC transporter ATP-binding protein [Verrucomicrobiota bacterium]
MSAAVQTERLRKEFPMGWFRGRVLALEGLDMEVQRGEVFGLLGPNGSGKSTAMKMILGLLRPTSGRAEVCGFRAGTIAARRQIGFLPENPYFPNFLSGMELVRYYGRLSGMGGSVLEKRIQELMELVRLGGEAGKRPLRTYSKGMLQRAGLAGAMVGDPEILMLDEPTAGVDPAGSREIRDLILELRGRGKTVIFSSHLLEQVEDVADRVIILHRGQKLREGRLEDLLTRKKEWEVSVQGLKEADRKELRGWLEKRGAEVVREGAPRERLEDYFLRSLPEEKRR